MTVLWFHKKKSLFQFPIYQHPLKQTQTTLIIPISRKPGQHRGPRNHILLRHFLKHLDGGLRIPRLHEPINHTIPRRPIPLRHFVKQHPRPITASEPPARRNRNVPQKHIGAKQPLRRFVKHLERKLIKPKFPVGVRHRGADEGIGIKTGFCRRGVEKGGGLGGTERGGGAEGEGESEAAGTVAGEEHEGEVGEGRGGERGGGESANQGVEEMGRRRRGRQAVEEGENVRDAAERSGGGDYGGGRRRVAGEEVEAEELAVDLLQVEEGASGMDERDVTASWAVGRR